MSQTRQLIEALKQCLRTKGVSYRDLADALGLSESSVKRLFSQQTFTMQRLEDICRFLDMSVFDLSRLAARSAGEYDDTLNEEQETALAKNPQLLTCFYLLLLEWSPARISNRLQISELAQVRLLAKLDRLKLIELHSGNRVKLLTSQRITWSVRGPIRQRYENKVKRSYVDYPFSGKDESLRLESSELSEASIKVLLRKVDRLVEEFAELAEIDRGLAPERKRSFGLMLAARPWTYWEIVGPA
ncbi:MAG: helix-turn-helix domain-containing protein [Lysobacterales bacterium]